MGDFKLKFNAAKMLLVHPEKGLAPYFAKGLYSLIPVNTTEVAVAGVDYSWRMYVNEEALKCWSVESLAMLTVHELRHLISKHGDRAKAVGVPAEHRKTWNIAADIEINQQLKKEGYAPPPQGWKTSCLPAHYTMADGSAMPEGKTAEWYYNELLKAPPVPDSEGDEDEGDDEGESGGEDNAESSPGGKPQEQPKNTKGDSEEDPQNSAEGSGVTGIPEDYELPEDNANTPKGVDKDQAKRLINEIAHDVEEAEMGSEHGDLKDWAHNTLNPKIDWRKELASQIRRAVQSKRGKSDYTYNKTSRRQDGRNYIVPAMIEYDPEIVVAVDTSGSMGSRTPSGDRILDVAVSEIDGILKGSGKSQVPVFAVDTEAADVQKVKSAKDVITSGGGGTNMSAGISAAEKMRPQPDVVIIVTDGYTPWPDRKPKGGMSVLVARIGMSKKERTDSYWKVPSWARVVDIDRDDL